MSRADDDAWEDLVRRLEAADSSAVQPASDEGQTEPTPHATPEDEGLAPPPPRDGQAINDSPTHPGQPRVPDAPRAVEGFDFRIDPALLGPSPAAPPSGAGPRDWSAAEEDPSEGAFEPPEPEPILAGRPDRVVAWIAALGLPFLMSLLSLFGRGSTPPLLWPILLIGSLAAWLYLFWRLPTERADDGDDGARL